MSNQKDYTKASVVVVGAGPAGLAAAITLKNQKPDLDVCVLEKGEEPGGHNLSGAVLEIAPLRKLLDRIDSGWSESDDAQEVLSRTVDHDDVRFLLGTKVSLPVSISIRMAKLLRIGFGQMDHRGDYIVSVSKLTKWLDKIARGMGIEVLYGFAVEDVVMDSDNGRAVGVKLVDQGRDRDGKPQQNYVPGETIKADVVVLAEGCDGLVTEKYVTSAGLSRQANPLFSVGVKELIEVSEDQYKKFGDGRVVHAMGYPLWTPIVGPGMFGGGIMYAFGENKIAVGMIVGADWKYCDFNPQDALVRFKEHAFVKQFIEGGTVVEAGAKMIPEGGYFSIPRDRQTQSVGKSNVLILGDSAGFVNMLKIKGLHNAIHSGMLAGEAVAATMSDPQKAAVKYTELLTASPVEKEMRSGRNYRQTVAKFGNLLGFPLSVCSNLLPKFEIEKDYEAMTGAKYQFKCENDFDKDAFTAVARTEHREEQVCHCEVRDTSLCVEKCPEAYGRPCIIFCPAGVYELIQGEMKPANPSNCLHCKTCQNKCPYDNLRWQVPEGGGGPRYENM